MNLGIIMLIIAILTVTIAAVQLTIQYREFIEKHKNDPSNASAKKPFLIKLLFHNKPGPESKPVPGIEIDSHCQELLAVMTDQTQPAAKRCEAGNALAVSGDPRFRPDAWFLPAEDLLGFVEIPAGPFQMGKDLPGAAGKDARQSPLHEVALETFFIGRFPVTVRQYQVFLSETGTSNPAGIQPGLDNHPAVSLSWYEALQYCHWLTQHLRDWPDTPTALGELLRSTRSERAWVVTLPSEAEWEKSARGMFDARAYPWGPQPDPNKANYRQTAIKAASTVGCFEGGCSPYKIHDLSGNVLEWTRSNWGSDVEVVKFKYPYDPEDGREDIRLPDTMLRIMRGGSFSSPAEDILCSCRSADLPDARYDHVGFRLVITQMPR